MDKAEFIIVLTTTDTHDRARDMARALVNSKLAACIEFHKVDSIYPWKGEVCETEEYVLVIKTRAVLYQELEEQIKKLHSYDLPQIISIPIMGGLTDYLDWLKAETKAP